MTLRPIKSLLLFALLAGSAFPQTTGTLGVILTRGTSADTEATPSQIPLDASGTNSFTTGLGAVWNQYEMLRVQPSRGPYDLSGVKLTLSSAITGSTSSQSIAISSTVGIPSTGINDVYLVIDGGTSVQEVVHVLSVVDATHVTAIARNNHSSGAYVQRVFSAYQNLYAPQTDPTYSVSGMSNVNFLRKGPLPANTFEQYRTDATCTPVEDDPLPWSSSASTTYALLPQYDEALTTATGNVTNGVLVGAGPYTAGINPLTCVEVQRFFTATPEPNVGGAYHRFYWDY